jgi:hypothetical protein
MKKYLIDTNIFIEHLKNNEKASKFLLENENCIVSYITAGELLQGARNKDENIKLSSILGNFELNLGSKRISKLAFDLLVQYQPKYGLQLLDSVIAATTITVDATLVTLNVKDFRFIDGLLVETLNHQ